MKRTEIRRKTPLRATGWLKRSPYLPVHGSRPKRRKRSRAEFDRIYGSPERAAWVKGSPCIVPGCLASPCDNAHVINGGAGKKADAKYVAPICHPHHNECDNARNGGKQTFQKKYGVNLLECAARTEAAWQALCAASPSPAVTPTGEQPNG